MPPIRRIPSFASGPKPFKKLDARPNANDRGYDVDWQRCRAAHIAREPTCRHCGALADEVDHIVPLSAGGSKLDDSNLQSLCRSCHRKKTLADQSKYPPPRP